MSCHIIDLNHNVHRYGTRRQLDKNYFKLHMKKFYELAGITGDGTNLTLRSLRTTVATRLNEAGVDDNVIMQIWKDLQ